MALSIAELAELEDLNRRATFRRKAMTVFVRRYNVPITDDITLPGPGDFFPGESSGPAVIDSQGVDVSVNERNPGEEVTVTVIAARPIYDTQVPEVWTHGTW
tara:strand:- start:290 stop:595 length:306 start_codon:yes stop_codon:yes gene_type:complete